MMDNIEIDDIYHHDFTTASEWEVFIARLEEIIREWKLPYTEIRSSLNKGDFIHKTWNQAFTKLQFADVKFLLKHFCLKLDDEAEKLEISIKECEDTPSQYMQDILDRSNDFAILDDEHLELATYYGISEFIVLTPDKHNIIADETRIKIMLSAITIALHNSNCKVPTFLQVQEPHQKFYLGVSRDRGISTSFDMVHLKRVPSYCTHLNGLLTLFQQKITKGCNISMEPVMVSARFSYVIKDWNSSAWTQEPPDFDFMQGETLGTVELGKLPFGAAFDPIEELHLFATWPHMPANVVVDSENYTDLDPRQAPEWSLQVKMMSSTSCLLEEYLTDFIHLCSNQNSLFELIGDLDIYSKNDGENFNSMFNVLTEPKLSTAIVRAALKKTTTDVGPISDDIMLPILYFLFPDAEDEPKAPYSVNIGYNVDDDPWKKLKTAAIDSLVWRLSIVAAHCTHNLGGPLALAHLWYEFVQEIRFRWEKSILIPGVGSGFPDCVRTCLLHQKLQMLNCCIERNVARKAYEHHPQSIDMADAESESEEEFFECTTEETSDNENSVHPPQHEMKHSLWNQPIGRSAKHQSLKLIATGAPLYIPVTQEPVPKTEDQLDNDADVMMELGTDKRASEMRARLMTASLLSDMESFKAANPGALLEDFIRWYSPRDWIEAEGFDENGRKKGCLSSRMMIPNNPWTNAWQSAQPVPAHRQKRLFDDTREAEKAIHYLLSQSVGEVGKLLLPVLMHVGLHMLRSQEQDALPSLPDIVQSILRKLQRATKPIQQRMELYQEIANDIGGIEALIAQANSLQHKLDDGNNSKDLMPFLIELMSGKEVSVPNEARENIASQITHMFQENQKVMHLSPSVSGDADAEAMSDEKMNIFPKPTARQFILRTIASRPTPMSTPRPQRLYASFKRDEFRLAAVFSDDTIIL